MTKRIENADELDALVGAASDGVALITILVGDTVLVHVPLIGVYLDGRFDVALPHVGKDLVTFDLEQVEVFA